MTLKLAARSLPKALSVGIRLTGLIVALLVGSSANAQGTGGVFAPVTLYTDFQQGIPQAVANALRNEVDSAMLDTGLEFDWHELSDFRSERVSAAVVVAHFGGRCDVVGMVMKGNQPGSLGWTEISDGKILPFTHVDCERVRTFLQTTLLGFRTEERERAFGRALGRVLVHELFHVFWSTQKHGTGGVAKEKYAVSDLLAEHFQFNEKQMRSLTAAKTLAALRASSKPLKASR
jgi:hypothetical protein